MISLVRAAQISKEKILTLDPSFRTKAEEWYNACCQAGITPYVYEGFRSMERQATLFAQGRTTPGVIVTQAQPGQSFHQYGQAVDWVTLIPNLKVADMYDAGWDDKEGYRTGQELGKKFGLRSLSWELPHLENADIKDWRVLADSKR